MRELQPKEIQVMRSNFSSAVSLLKRIIKKEDFETIYGVAIRVHLDEAELHLRRVRVIILNSPYERVLYRTLSDIVLVIKRLRNRKRIMEGTLKEESLRILNTAQCLIAELRPISIPTAEDLEFVAHLPHLYLNPDKAEYP